MPSQAKGVVDDTHAKQWGSFTNSQLIPILAPNEKILYTHSEVIDDSTKQLVDEMITVGPTPSSDPSTNFIQ